jgi:hypothetical protein
LAWTDVEWVEGRPGSVFTVMLERALLQADSGMSLDSLAKVVQMRTARYVADRFSAEQTPELEVPDRTAPLSWYLGPPRAWGTKGIVPYRQRARRPR